MTLTVVSCEPHGLCLHSSCFDQFFDSLGHECSETHFYPAKMSCSENHSFGKCDGLGKCEIDSEYSCPASCEHNFIIGCHNYTLNPTHPCTDENLCHYEITLAAGCGDQPICLPQNTTTPRNLTNHLNVHVEECIEIGTVTDEGPVSSVVCTPRDLVLIENTPQKVSDGLSVNFPNEPEPLFLEFAPGVPAEDSSEFFPGYDGSTRVCISEWHYPASHPYCAYDCYPQPMLEYFFSSERCDAQHHCTSESRRVVISYDVTNPF